jgi:hypothetical protein
VRRRHGAPFGVGFLIAREVNHPADIAAYRARREQIEEHADQVIFEQIYELRLDPQRPPESRPAHGTNRLGTQIDDQRQRDPPIIRRRKGFQKALGMNSRNKIN